MNRIMKFLVFGLCLMVVPAVAMADFIGVFQDATGRSFCLSPGFSSTNAIIHRSMGGSTGSRFKVIMPNGTDFQGFSTPFVTIGELPTDLSFGYGECKTGSFVLGTMIWNLTEGMVRVAPADNQTSIINVNCNFAELPARGGRAQSTYTPVGICLRPSSDLDAALPLATESSTWGHVKSLYR